MEDPAGDPAQKGAERGKLRIGKLENCENLRQLLENLIRIGQSERADESSRLRKPGGMKRYRGQEFLNNCRI